MTRRGHDQRSGILVLVVALSICAVVTRVHERNQKLHGTDPVLGAVRDAALVPALTASASWVRWWHVHTAGITQGPMLAREQTDLQRQVVELTRENTFLEDQRIENARLRALLSFARTSQKPLLPAEVIALKPSSQADTLTINRGRSEGLRIHSVVLAPNGSLVGQVYQQSQHSSDVIMLTDTLSSVGAVVIGRGSSRPIGICKGDRSGLLRLTDLQGDADVSVGDHVITAGLGNVFPRQLPIGIVTKVTTDETRSMKIAIVKPSADFDHLDDALVVE